MGLLYGENCMILTSTVFDWSTSVTDRRTDGQTDGQTDRRAIAYSALSMLSRAKNDFLPFSSETIDKTKNFFVWNQSLHVDVVDSGYFKHHFGHAADWNAVTARREEQNLFL